MRVKIKNLVVLIAGSADSVLCRQAHSTGRHTKTGAATASVTAPAYRIISTR